MVEQAHISDMIVQEVGTIRPDESVRVARRRMEAQTRRSLIVVDEGRPVGIVQWRDLLRQDESTADAPISDIMSRDFPILTSATSVSEARQQLGDVDVDHLPVVDTDGRLVGEVPRGALAHQEVAENVAGEPGTADAGGASAQELNVIAGQDVIGTGDKKLGSVDQIIVDPENRLLAFTVAHGLFGRKHKRIPADVIDHVDQDKVYLSIGNTEFNMLADIEEQE